VSREAEYLRGALASAKARPLPVAADRYHVGTVKLLVGLCAELQRLAGDRPFILSCRGAGSALGIRHQRAHQYLRRLMRDEVIVCTLTGTYAGGGASGTASEYRYRGRQA
jgi:hypothetical protein